MITQYLQRLNMNVGIASLQRQPLDVLSWMRYHKDVGITYFYFWLEDSPDYLPLVYKIGEDLKVTVYAELAPTVDRSAEDNYFDLMTRQEEFINRMIRKARIDGVKWLFHIDDDELLYLHDRKPVTMLLASVSPSYDSVHFHNWEGFAPEHVADSWYRDRGVRYLPASCAGQFSAYSNGKAATRTTIGQEMRGPHHFSGKEFFVSEGTAVVLHHDGLPMSKEDLPPKLWVRKNQLRLTSNLTKIPFASTHDAVKALRTGNPKIILEAWKKHRSQTGDRFKACDTPRALPLHSYTFTDKVV